MNKDKLIKKTSIIMKQCLNINKMASDKKSPAVWFVFSGHVDSLEVNIMKNGWKEDGDYIIRMEVYLDKKDAEKRLDEIIAYLTELEEELQTGKREAVKVIRTGFKERVDRNENE